MYNGCLLHLKKDNKFDEILIFGFYTLYIIKVVIYNSFTYL